MITQPINEDVRVPLPGNVHRIARMAEDQGPVPASFRAERMLLVLQRGPGRQKALAQFIQAAHRPGEPQYHRWITPADFGQRFGPSDADVAIVRAWLEKSGFAVARVTAGKTAIEFSGDAAQVRAAFRTQIHAYAANGTTYHANDRDPEIPAALAPVVAGVTTLNDIRPRSYAKVLGSARFDARTHATVPQWTFGSNEYALAPGDFAVQYDVNPLYQAGTDGTGVTIGIIGASNVDPAIVANYRTLFGLPARTLNVIVDGSDPGENGAALESYLDVEVAGSVAPGANIDLYTAADTDVQAGLFLAAQRAVDEDAATVLSMSYGECEQDLGAAGNLLMAQLWEQAAAQGQTVMVSAGDAGSAGCDDFNEPLPAQYGLAVNGMASTPWNVSVGGTDFYYTSYAGTPAAQAAELAKYWNATPTETPVVSLLKPVPEQPWNEPFGLDLDTGGVFTAGPFESIVGGSGGVSSCVTGTSAADGTYASCTAGYAKPGWQTGSGVPQDAARDLPDVSLFAAAGENDSFWPICATPVDCVNLSGSMLITGVGGTSASSPAMAGILALVNQRYGAQGQANYVLYPLAAQTPAAFHDVTIGSNVVPCLAGSPNCGVSALNDNTKGFETLGHYYAGTGYDQASGLGSVDAAILVKNWNTVKLTTTSTSLSLSQTTFEHGTPVNVKVGVTASGGTPSGDVALTSTAAPAANAGLGVLTLASGAAAAMRNDLPGGQYSVTARYGGDGMFATSDSNPVAVTVTPEASTVGLTGSWYVYDPNNATNPVTSGPVASGASYAYGTYIVVDAQPKGVHAPAGGSDGPATGQVKFSDTGSSGQASIALDRTGTASWGADPGFTVGAHSVNASYGGDASYAASSSAPALSFTMTQAQPLFIFPTISAPSPLGSAVKIQVIVGIPSAVDVTPPTGTLTVTYNGQTVGTGTLASLTAGFAAATVTVQGLPLGTDTLTVQYPGDPNFMPASVQTHVSVLEPATLTATAAPNPVSQGGTAVVTATIAGTQGVAAPTGGVWMGTPNYSCGTAAPFSATNATSSCSFTASLLSLGTNVMTVEYLGDSVYAPVTIAVPVTVVATFTIAATPVTIAAPGATTGNTSTVTLTPQGGYTGMAYLACALKSSPSGAQNPPTCGIPASVNIPSSSPVTATMMFTSVGGSSGAMERPPLRKGGWATGAILAIGLLLGIPGRRRRWRTLVGVMALLAVFAGVNACGGGGGSTGTTTVTATTPGTYTYTASVSYVANPGTGQQQSVDVQVTVQ